MRRQTDAELAETLRARAAMQWMPTRSPRSSSERRAEIRRDEDAARRGDDTRFVEIRILPTEENLEAVRDYDGPEESLSQAEQFFTPPSSHLPLHTPRSRSRRPRSSCAPSGRSRGASCPPSAVDGASSHLCACSRFRGTSCGSSACSSAPLSTRRSPRSPSRSRSSRRPASHLGAPRRTSAHFGAPRQSLGTSSAHRREADASEHLGRISADLAKPRHTSLHERLAGRPPQGGVWLADDTSATRPPHPAGRQGGSHFAGAQEGAADDARAGQLPQRRHKQGRRVGLQARHALEAVRHKDGRQQVDPPPLHRRPARLSRVAHFFLYASTCLCPLQACSQRRRRRATPPAATARRRRPTRCSSSSRCPRSSRLCAWCGSTRARTCRRCAARSSRWRTR